MAQSVRLLRTGIACLVAGALSVAAGFSQSGIRAEADPFQASDAWSEVTLPVDYSGSRDRIEFELAAMSLFGPARSALDADGEAAPAEPAVRLVAIAQLDNTMFALLEETGGQMFRLKVGDSTPSGWTVRRIDKAEVQVARSNEQLALALFSPRLTEAPGAEETPRKRKR